MNTSISSQIVIKNAAQKSSFYKILFQFYSETNSKLANDNSKLKSSDLFHLEKLHFLIMELNFPPRFKNSQPWDHVYLTQLSNPEAKGWIIFLAMLIQQHLVQ